ncbi:MAG: hypothetical protein ACHREM_05420 [Polyangiales bacterium]
MVTPTEFHEFPLTLRVPKSAFVVVAPPPATVTQRTVEQHVGITPRAFKRLVRDGRLSAKRLGHLIVVDYEEIRRVLTDGAEVRKPLKRDVEKVEVAPDDEPMSIAAAEAYMSTAMSTAERKTRKQEVLDLAGDLAVRYGPTLEDGSPNPNHDKRLFEHSLDLTIRTAIATKRPARVRATGVSPGVGHYRKCCWCERPAYATKQSWEGTYWCGGPVCETHARGRAPNERVVQIETSTILLPAKDPSVPKEYDVRRRRRKPR